MAQLLAITAESRAVARVEGLSGLGKTRLVLEAFRPKEGTETVRQWSDRLVYLDASVHESELYPFCVDLCNRQLEGIIVEEKISGKVSWRERKIGEVLESLEAKDVIVVSELSR
jgi:hypothetical protein